MSAVVRLIDRRVSVRHGQEDPTAARTRDHLSARLARAAIAGLDEAGEPVEGTNTVVLHRDELIADEAGEILLRPGGSEAAVLLVTSASVVATGRSVPHITAGGENVSGCRYLRFADGLVLHYPSDLRLEIVHPTDGDA